MITPPAMSLVRIRKENGYVVGAGFLVDNEQHLLTCAHVVAKACNCDSYQDETPQATIFLDFPFLKSERLLKARVVFWQPIQDDGSGDVAGLELLDDLPIGSEAVSFAPAEYLWDHDFRAYGFPKGHDDGIWATGRLLERQGTGWIQVDDTKTEGFAVVEGFSGGPVWDIQLEGVVGMVVTASRHLEAKTAFAIPLDVLAQAWPLLKITVQQRQRQYLFISACPDDVDYVTRLSAELTKSEITVWHEQHLPGSSRTDPQKRLQQAISAAQVVVLALSPQTSSWQTVKEHLRLADLYSRRLIQLWVSPDEPPAHLFPSNALQTAWVDTRTTPHEVVLQAIKSNLSQQRTITGLLDPFSVEELPWEPRNPYKGLRAFREDDKDDFFGRDDLVSELLTDIEKLLAVEPSAENQGRFLTLIGPSDSGKSSVLMAGLLPQLKQGSKLIHSEQWVYLAPIVPGEHSLQALVNTLGPHLPDIEPEILQKKLEADSTFVLHQLIIPLVKQWGMRVVLVVDQFEELFTRPGRKMSKGVSSNCYKLRQQSLGDHCLSC